MADPGSVQDRRQVRTRTAEGVFVSSHTLSSRVKPDESIVLLGMVRWLAEVLITLLATEFGAAFHFPESPVAVVRRAPVAPELVVTASPAPALEVGSAIALDFSSGSILYQRDATRLYPIASITKLMTALVVVDTAPAWTALVTIRESDLRPGGRVLLLPGEQVSVVDLMHGMLVASSNEAAIALARATGLTLPAFVRAMNVKADALGLPSLHFVDPVGLEPENVGTARDVARLVQSAVGIPILGQALQQRTYSLTVHPTGSTRQAESTNPLLGNGSVAAGLRIAGGKTGYLEEAGYNVVVVVERQGHRVSLALLGARSSDDRWRQSRQLAEWIFTAYRWPELGG